MAIGLAREIRDSLFEQIHGLLEWRLEVGDVEYLVSSKNHTTVTAVGRGPGDKEIRRMFRIDVTEI
jgi:hypothetical protein